MATDNNRPSHEPEVRLVAGPELWNFEFQRKAEPKALSEEAMANLNFSLSITRFPERKLGVELSAIVEDPPRLKIVATFRTVFEIVAEASDAVDEEKIWRAVGALIAPGMMYPFIREMITSATQKAGLPAIVPPLVVFANVFDPNTINLPPRPSSEATKPGDAPVS